MTPTGTYCRACSTGNRRSLSLEMTNAPSVDFSVLVSPCNRTDRSQHHGRPNLRRVHGEAFKIAIGL